MRCWFIVLLGILLCATALAATPKGFFATWPEAQKAAKAANKPIYLHFTTTWCGWCRKIEDETYPSDKAKAALADYVAASLDCTMPKNVAMSDALKTNVALYKKFGGDGYPFLAMCTPDGELLHIINGYVPPDVFARQLAEGKARLKELRDFQKYAATADQTTLDFSVRAFQLYCKLGQTDNAAKYAKKLLELDPKNEKGLALSANVMLLKALPKEQWPDGATPIIDRIIKLDPENAQRKMQEALTMLGDYYFSTAQRTGDAKQRIALLQGFVDTYNRMVAGAKTLDNPQLVYALLGYAHLQMQHKADALANLQKALNLDPNSRLAGQVKQLLSRAEALK